MPALGFVFFALLCASLYGLFLHATKKPCSLHVIVALSMIPLSATLSYAQRATHEKFCTFAHGKTLDTRGEIRDIARVDRRTCNTRITLATTELRENNTGCPWRATCATLHIYTNNTQGLRVGDTVEISNLAYKRPRNTSFCDYLLRENVAATIFCNKFSYTRLSRPQSSLRRIIFEKKQQLFFACKKKLSRNAFGLFSSLFLGKKEYRARDAQKTKEIFTVWGLTHYLARSGLHLILIVLLWHLLLSLLPVHHTYKQLLLIFFIGIYALLSWPSVSFNRALFTFFIYKICILMRIPAHVLHIITMLCFVLLMYNPMHLFFLDFQLSFGLTYSLALLNHIHAQTRSRVA